MELQTMACGFPLQSEFHNHKDREVAMSNAAVERLKELSCMEL
jgi:hypothetical protein